MQKLLNSKNCVQLVWENNNLTDFIILIPDQQFKMLTLNEFNIYQIFKIGIGYPMNYQKCNKKIFTYLQLHKFNYELKIHYDIPVNLNEIKDRMKQYNKLQFQFDTDMIDYFKSIHEKLFIKSYLKLANLEYKEKMTDQVVASHLSDYQCEIHSQIFYNAINIKQFIKDKFEEDLEEIVLPKNDELTPHHSVFDTFQQLSGMTIKIEDVSIPKLPYVPGFLI